MDGLPYFTVTTFFLVLVVVVVVLRFRLIFSLSLSNSLVSSLISACNTYLYLLESVLNGFDMFGFWVPE